MGILKYAPAISLSQIWGTAWPVTKDRIQWWSPLPVPPLRPSPTQFHPSPTQFCPSHSLPPLQESSLPMAARLTSRQLHGTSSWHWADSTRSVLWHFHHTGASIKGLPSASIRLGPYSGIPGNKIHWRIFWCAGVGLKVLRRIEIPWTLEIRSGPPVVPPKLLFQYLPRKEDSNGWQFPGTPFRLELALIISIAISLSAELRRVLS